MAQNKNIYLLGIVLAIVVNVFSWHLPFFWDTILTSTITQHFFFHGFGNFISPSQYDAGHPPFFYIYVTGFYHIFGKNLFAAHLSILPFTILGIVSFIQLLQHFSFSKQQQIFGVVLYFSIPAIITQNILVSYDAVLLSLYLAAFVAFLKDKKILFSFLLIGIVGISLRGLFCLISLSITIYFLLKKDIKSWMNWSFYFVPSILIIAVWYVYHYTQTGWFLSTNATGWSQQRGFVNTVGFLKNSLSIARCFSDLGIVILSLLSLYYFIQKKKIDNFILIALIPIIIFSISFLPYSNPINHRYFLIVYVLMIPIVIQFLSNKKLILSVLTILVLWFGNLQIYPVPISNGWDCTLAHLSYFKCEDDFNKICDKVWLDKIKDIGTVFPMNASLYQTKMHFDTIKKINVHEKKLDSTQMVLFSNIGNDFSDEQIIELKNWPILYQTKHGVVELILYDNPKNIFDKVIIH